jgi:hypothetical protein
MRSITLVQAFRYWFKLMALAVPVFVIAIITRPGVQSLFAGHGRRPAPASVACIRSPRCTR